MQVFVRGDCTMIAAPVQCDVDGIPKGSHFARVQPTARQTRSPTCRKRPYWWRVQPKRSPGPGGLIRLRADDIATGQRFYRDAIDAMASPAHKLRAEMMMLSEEQIAGSDCGIRPDRLSRGTDLSERAAVDIISDEWLQAAVASLGRPGRRPRPANESTQTPPIVSASIRRVQSR